MAEGGGLKPNLLGGSLTSPARRCGKLECMAFSLPFAGTRRAETGLNTLSITVKNVKTRSDLSRRLPTVTQILVDKIAIF